MGVVGIRREDKSVWEARVPVVPADVARLVEQGVEFEVERSPQRCIPDAEFEAAGARLVDEFDRASVILGVKEIPIDKLREGCAYLFFSHTIKGQPYNMPLLQAILDRGCTLLDYELITDDEGVRTVAFGRHAGLAGCVDTLHALGHRLAREGHVTPLAALDGAHSFGEIAPALEQIRAAATEIERQGLPPEISPLVIGITGEGGKVWGGAREVLEAAGAKEIEAEELASFVENFEGTARNLYFVSYDPGDLVEPLDSRAYDFQDYLDHPEAYRSRFGGHLEFLSAVVYGILWSPGYPRFLLREEVQRARAASSPPRLRVITDITCDPGGSNELLDHATDPGSPCYVVDPEDGSWTEGADGNGVLLWAVDILPAEIPLDASRHFSEVLTPLVPALARADLRRGPAGEGLPPSLKGAFLAVAGELRPEWREQLEPALARHGRAPAQRSKGESS
jgi:alpha-aminoadipic semialdehyde synthase